MKSRPKWHKSLLGKIILFIGSIRFAVPLLILTAMSLMYGTWVESTETARQAGIAVYGSWWFITLMALICITLILAVVTRYPLRKKHTGFVIVHASMITVIVSGFVTFFEKVEGEIALQEGMSAQVLRTGSNELQLLSHDEGQFNVLDAEVIERVGTQTIHGVQIEVVEQWDNSTEQTVVLDDGPNKLHAVEVLFDDEPGDGFWIGQLRDGETPPMLHGFEIRVLPEGKTWTPPELEGHSRPIFRHAKNETIMDIGEVGSTVSAGWTIESIERFEHAIVGTDGLNEGDSDRDNPAIQVTLVHTDGSIERHAAFDRFRGSVNKKALAGELFSELILDYTGQGFDRATLALTRTESATTALFVSPDGVRTQQELTGDGPWTLALGDHQCTILHAYANARGTTELIESPQGAENSPALRVVVHGGESTEPMTLVWGRRSMVQVGEELFGIAYAPSTIDVPFGVELIDFRKMDYPGSEMAMAYESDVVFTDAEGNTHEQTIWMNNPLEYEGWKIYQAGFVGSDVSIFQVTKDPGLKAMYIGCIGVCLGILVMYYSKAYSHGHPGMPKVFDAKNKRRTIHATAHNNPADSGHADDRVASNSGHPVRSGLENQVRANPDSTTRAHDADGHLRKKGRGRSHRTHKVG